MIEALSTCHEIKEGWMMIVFNNAFLYIHNPKTGGTFVSEMLRKVVAENQSLSIYEPPELKHAGVKKIPEEYRGLPVVINVRNVFEHYVSRYTFGWWAEPEHAEKMFDMGKVLQVFPGFPKLSFSDFLALFNDWSLRRGITEKQADRLAANNMGYNSWVLTRLTRHSPLKILNAIDQLDDTALKNLFSEVRFLRTERLNVDLYDLLKDYGCEEGTIHSILSAPPILPKKGGRGSKKATWDSYFRQEDISSTMEKDRLLFRLFPDMIP